MALLTLQDIGKIYVSEGNVAVGIRGIDLTFERGEFVAITGKSGSGKSTLLNVISGMDTYEEGELYIEGEPTSHYLQPDWEEYRKKYISFIFQDYNIIESYTVLQNVELALMSIEDRGERRRRALELLDRVGLTDHLHHKGSKLSGGQKQRTVIARALAKDSPIILADEPTGNLDSATSAEIIELLREVSRDKLLIVVTHNFEQVEHCATRHIRVFDGAVEFDRAMQPPAEPIAAVAEDAPTMSDTKKKPKKKTAKKGNNLRNGITLGRSMFTSRPRLSVFMCLLMVLGALSIFLLTSLLGDGMSSMVETYEMFNHVDGRLVLTKRSGEVITEEELTALATQHGASSQLHYDILLDQGEFYTYIADVGRHVPLKYTYGETFEGDIVGRYPEAENEVFLQLPLYCQGTYGKDVIEKETIYLENLEFKVVGLQYFYDNNQQGKIVFSKDGFDTLTAIHCLLNQADPRAEILLSMGEGQGTQAFSVRTFYPVFSLEGGEVYVENEAYRNMLSNLSEADRAKAETSLAFYTTYYTYNSYYGYDSQNQTYSAQLGKESITETKPTVDPSQNVESNFQGNGMYDHMIEVYPMGGGDEGTVYLTTACLRRMAADFLGQSYRQASLFFASDKDAAAVGETLRQGEYIAVLSDTEYNPDPFETILSTVGGLLMVVLWVAAILFLGFFISLCSTRSLDAFKGDMAIMRSMGIPVRVIRIGMYVRMLLSLIPAYLSVALVALLVFLTPRLNGIFSYLYLWQYALIFVGMLLLTVRVTHKQIRRLFGESVKKALKGGTAA